MSEKHSKSEKNKKIRTVVELVVYTLGGLMALWGLTYMCLGFSVHFISYKSAVTAADTHLKETTNGMGFLEQGLLVLFIAVIVVTIFLLVFAKSADRQFEKEQRRAAARTNRRFGNVQEETVVEVNSAPAQE